MSDSVIWLSYRKKRKINNRGKIWSGTSCFFYFVVYTKNFILIRFVQFHEVFASISMNRVAISIFFSLQKFREIAQLPPKSASIESELVIFFKACILPINSRINEGKLNVRSSFNFTRRSVMVENCLSPISAGPNEPEPELPKLGLFPFPPWPWCLFFRLLINTGSSSKTGVFWSKYNCRPAKKKW